MSRKSSIRYELRPAGISDHLQFVNGWSPADGQGLGTSGSVDITLASDALEPEPDMIIAGFGSVPIPWVRRVDRRDRVTGLSGNLDGLIDCVRECRVAEVGG